MAKKKKKEKIEYINLVSKDKIYKEEYNILLNKVNWFIDHNINECKIKNKDLIFDPIFSKAISNYIKYKPSCIEKFGININKDILDKALNKIVSNILKDDYFAPTKKNPHSKYKEYQNTLQINPVVVKSEEDSDENDITLKDVAFNDKAIEIYENEQSEIEYIDSISYIYKKLDDTEKILFRFIEENKTEYKWSIGRICKELNISYYTYNKCLEKIKKLCIEVFHLK